MLKVRIFTPTFISVSRRPLEALSEGINASGDDCRFTDDLDAEADVAVHVSGVKDLGGGRFAGQLNAARAKVIERFPDRRLIVESAIFRCGQTRPEEKSDPYYRLSLNGFMADDGTYHPPEFTAPPDRWNRLVEEQGIELKPWRLRKDGYILLCSQKPSDASLRGQDVTEWISETIATIRRSTNRQVIVRPHPLDPTRPKRTTSLYEDLAGAWASVSYTSLSAIESVCEGVPTFATNPGNHAWPVACQPLTMIEDPARPSDRLRFEWLYRLAYCQWRLSEFKEGTPWRRLRSCL